jgi:hypothetical protein
MELAFFLKDKKTPLLRPRLAHVVGQFTDTQAGGGISTGGDESHLHVDVMAPGLVGDFKDRHPRVLIPPSVPHLAEEFPLKILLYIINLRLNGARRVSLLVPALPPFAGKTGGSAGTRPLTGANPGAVLQEITHAAKGAATHGHSRRRPACIQVRSLTLSGEGQASVPPLSP